MSTERSNDVHKSTLVASTSSWFKETIGTSFQTLASLVLNISKVVSLISLYPLMF
jgi:hypothetical protein